MYADGRPIVDDVDMTDGVHLTDDDMTDGDMTEETTEQ
jgi:hypothetical protein